MLIVYEIFYFNYIKEQSWSVIPIQQFLNASRVSAMKKLVCYVGDTPLHECVKNGMLSCIQALLRKGSDVNHKNLQGFSPLHIAVRAGEKFSMEILRELVTRGYSTDVNIPESLGKRQYTRVTR